MLQKATLESAGRVPSQITHHCLPPDSNICRAPQSAHGRESCILKRIEMPKHCSVTRRNACYIPMQARAIRPSNAKRFLCAPPIHRSPPFPPDDAGVADAQSCAERQAAKITMPLKRFWQRRVPRAARLQRDTPHLGATPGENWRRSARRTCPLSVPPDRSRLFSKLLKRKAARAFQRFPPT